MLRHGIILQQQKLLLQKVLPLFRLTEMMKVRLKLAFTGVF